MTASNSSPFSIQVSTTGAAEHPMKHNVWGGFHINNSSRNFDPTYEAYHWLKTAPLLAVQHLQIFSRTDRQTRVNNWLQAFSEWPLGLYIMHDTPLSNTPSYVQQNWAAAHHRTRYMLSQPRENVLLYINAGDAATEINANRQTTSTLPNRQAGVTVRITHPETRDYMARAAVDFLAGSDLQTNVDVADGLDMSDYAMWWHDGTAIPHPKSGGALVRDLAKGTLTSIVSENAQQALIVEIDAQPNPATGGTLAQDASFSTMSDSATPLMCWDGSSSSGFIGYHVVGYKNVANGRAQLYLKTFPGIAASSQVKPSGGWRYWLGNNNSPSTNVDWDHDAVSENGVSEASADFMAGFNAYWDLIDTYMEQVTGKKSGRGWNGISSSGIVKLTSGLPAPHTMTATADVSNSEEAEGRFGIGRNGSYGPVPVAEGHAYNIRRTKMEEGMRHLHFAGSFIRPNPPNEWITDKARGALVDFSMWGNDWSDVNELDASYLRFYWAITRTVPDVTMGITLEAFQGRPAAIEEFFLDFTTGWDTHAPQPLGVWDEAGGPMGAEGPMGSWTWATPEAGERIFIRRFGNKWLCAMNCADLPMENTVLGGMGYEFYAPSHLPGGFTPRDPEDVITAADFNGLYSSGVLSSGETLRHFDPSAYVNPAVTAWLQGNTTFWQGFNYGPRQAHPSDAVATTPLAQAAWIARDNVRNDGATVDTGQNYALGPFEAVFWEIQ